MVDHFPNPHPLLNKTARLKYRDVNWNIFPCTLVATEALYYEDLDPLAPIIFAVCFDETTGEELRFQSGGWSGGTGLVWTMMDEWFGFKTNKTIPINLIWGKVPRLCKCGHPKSEHTHVRERFFRPSLDNTCGLCKCNKFIRSKKEK